MKHTFLNYLFLSTVVFMLASCNDPVFYAISQEVEPIKPRIDGASTNFATFGGDMYVASGSTLYKYTGSWTETKPGGKIIQLASTDNYLYALFYDEVSQVGNMSLKRYNGTNWSPVSGNTGDNTMQYIYAVNDIPFIGAGYSNSYTVFYVDENANEIKELILVNIADNTITGEISGAGIIGTDYYISTKGSGIFKVDISSMTAKQILGTNGINFFGMINLNNDTIALITRNGRLYTFRNDTLTEEAGITMGERMASGALAIWYSKDEPSRRLLLVGRQDFLETAYDAGYTYGYMELEFEALSGTIIGNYTEPGINALSTVNTGDNEHYKSSIGKYPVNHIFQANDGILFASTQKNGVFSYRQRGRNNDWQWNAEE